MSQKLIELLELSELELAGSVAVACPWFVCVAFVERSEQVSLCCEGIPEGAKIDIVVLVVFGKVQVVVRAPHLLFGKEFVYYVAA